MNSRYAQFSAETAWLSQAWAEKLAREKFGDDKVNALGRFVRGARKGLCKGQIIITRCTRGGWVRIHAGYGEGESSVGYVERNVGRVVRVNLQSVEWGHAPKDLAEWSLHDEMRRTQAAPEVPSDVCVVCGGPAPAASRCTNRRCADCHRTHCTEGGATSPGHNPIGVDVDGRALVQS